jgi:large subunit ribosomal protein L30
MVQLQIKQIKSAIGRQAYQAQTLRSLGLKRIGHTVVKDDKPEFRGMINAVSHLVEVQEV